MVEIALFHEVSTQQINVFGIRQYLGGELNQQGGTNSIDLMKHITNYDVQSQTCSSMSKCHGGLVVQGQRFAYQWSLNPLIFMEICRVCSAVYHHVQHQAIVLHVPNSNAGVCIPRHGDTDKGSSQVK